MLERLRIRSLHCRVRGITLLFMSMTRRTRRRAATSRMSYRDGAISSCALTTRPTRCQARPRRSFRYPRHSTNCNPWFYRATPVVCLPHSEPTGNGCGSAEEPCKERDGRVAGKHQQLPKDNALLCFIEDAPQCCGRLLVAARAHRGVLKSIRTRGTLSVFFLAG
jgi:hypothetical protein